MVQVNEEVFFKREEKFSESKILKYSPEKMTQQNNKVLS